MRCNCKLALRADRPAGVVRAFVSAMDDTDREEIARISIGLLDAVPGLFDRWVALLQDAFKAVLEEVTGQTVAGFERWRPHQKN